MGSSISKWHVPISISNRFAPSLHELAVADACETQPSVGKFMRGRGGVGGLSFGISGHMVHSGGPLSLSLSAHTQHESPHNLLGHLPTAGDSYWVRGRGDQTGISWEHGILK